ncbi:hypothetical protein [Methylobacterium brachiatum]|uniref:hypothetical protein n=1 Tax=Methylobacterium brachiatum TaxID=269660 RepID=UPI000EFD3030|nr:hypothetical protein [Methylobacterium brachiatum]AYO85373.1 hypothetical protein EBB05_26210 [Methylobacterium brachiatum]
MIDISQTVAPKSDQLNADDLIGGPRTITVTRVSKMKEPDQPIAIYFEGDGGKPYKPGKSMRRVLLRIWGQDGATYAGRRMTLYRDDAVQFGGVAVGGIRISHMSGISSAVTIPLTVTRASRKPFTVKPLAEERRPAPAEKPKALPAPTDDEQGTERQSTPRERMFAAARVEAAKGSDALRAFRQGLPEKADRALDEITEDLERIAAGADVADDDFPGFAPAEEDVA